MTALKSLGDLSEVEISKSARAAALSVVERLTREKEAIAAQWETAIRLAQANGASLRDVARAAKVSPQTIANLRKG